jgi:purine-binding chemotaxis protein CheW
MSNAVTAQKGQYLTFSLAEEIYGCNVLRVSSVLEYKTVTRVPRMPDYMTGVINLRGEVLPVIDLKKKFALGQTEKTQDTCIIVVEVKMDQEQINLGVLTDNVNEVISLDEGSIEAPPKIGTNLDTSFIQGMGRKDDNFIILLDIDRIFSAEDIQELSKGREMSMSKAHSSIDSDTAEGESASASV